MSFALQGKKAKGRTEELSKLSATCQQVLSVLGLWKQEPGAVLQEMRELALARYFLTWQGIILCLDWQEESCANCFCDSGQALKVAGQP